jgi:sulfatase maturation enzyme AslB (radical SAM superfamily)
MNSHLVTQFISIENCSLPVFEQTLQNNTLFYTPGMLVVANAHYAKQIETQLLRAKPSIAIVSQLQYKAKTSKAIWTEKYHHKQYRPVCLTLYTSQKCNLNCSYCFSQDSQFAGEVDLSLERIKQGAEIVAGNCKRLGIDFSLVIHGGGEPTQDHRLGEIVNLIDAVVKKYHIGIFKYIATNGVMSEQKAKWLVNNFDQIGLSCDGSEDIHSIQRPLKNGKSSLSHVFKTAEIIKKSNIPLAIRVTITQDTLLRMPETAKFLCDQLGADEIRVEPAFWGGRNDEQKNMHLKERQAEIYCDLFLQARAIAKSYEVSWKESGSRLDELHFRNCQIFRDVLHLLPGNETSACFNVSGSKEAKKLNVPINKEHDRGLEVDVVKVGLLQNQLSVDFEKCNTCFIQFQCDRGCPDMCPIKTGSTDNELRCKINQMLSTAILREKAIEQFHLLDKQPYVSIAIDEKIYL